MNDLARMKTTFYVCHIKYTLEAFAELQSAKYYGEEVTKYNAVLKIKNGCGYNGFYTNFYFLNNECVGHGVWE